MLCRTLRPFSGAIPAYQTEPPAGALCASQQTQELVRSRCRCNRRPLILFLLFVLPSHLKEGDLASHICLCNSGRYCADVVVEVLGIHVAIHPKILKRTKSPSATIPGCWGSRVDRPFYQQCAGGD
ncbi:hypothetical protein BDBG_07636 [Blastomyces gilchristii SLH14081]|uniref:Uncharacterized protein n=1 Tax=Blastomyces gilchristii (strain SLH14081) TaxID=559298 RepID=A0A179UVX2_BLAGS|nr:uncharacterized protein BDBG_07636 [Blastomyces gilchristii SLH14081]OAT12265.1 hypothetical protein BDBG_07636 [Blastomyces gilchristii SLH14081]